MPRFLCLIGFFFASAYFLFADKITDVYLDSDFEGNPLTNGSPWHINAVGGKLEKDSISIEVEENIQFVRFRGPDSGDSTTNGGLVTLEQTFPRNEKWTQLRMDARCRLKDTGWRMRFWKGNLIVLKALDSSKREIAAKKPGNSPSESWGVLSATLDLPKEAAFIRVSLGAACPGPFDVDYAILYDDSE